jgi:hypothetical protein
MLMKKKVVIFAVSLLFMIGLISGCNEQTDGVVDDKNKFIGTWKITGTQHMTNETWKFFKDKTVEQISPSHNGTVSDFYNWVDDGNDTLCLSPVDNPDYELCYDYTFNEDYSSFTLVRGDYIELVFQKLQ